MHGLCPPLTPAGPLLCVCRPGWQGSEALVPSFLTSRRIEQLLSRYPGTLGCWMEGVKSPAERQVRAQQPLWALSPPAAAAAPGADLAGGVDLG